MGEGFPDPATEWDERCNGCVEYRYTLASSFDGAGWRLGIYRRHIEKEAGGNRLLLVWEVCVGSVGLTL